MTAVDLSEIIRNYALVAAAIGGALIALWRAIAADRQSKAQAVQFLQTRQEHAAKLFADAVERLGDERLHVRLGAILTLRELVDAYPDLSRNCRSIDGSSC